MNWTINWSMIQWILLQWVLSPKYFDFPFPITLTMIHMGFSGAVAFFLIRVFKVMTSYIIWFPVLLEPRWLLWESQNSQLSCGWHGFNSQEWTRPYFIWLNRRLCMYLLFELLSYHFSILECYRFFKQCFGFIFGKCEEC